MGADPGHPRPLPRSGSSDPYCVVKVDNEVVARYGDTVPRLGGGTQGWGIFPGGRNHLCHPGRTATVWKSLNPFWGEEITLLLPRGFHSLTIYVLDEDTIG